jgi:hypothetical protein
MGHLGRTEGMELKVGIFLLKLPEQGGIKIQSKIGMMASLKQQLVAAIFKGFLDLFPISGHVCDIGFGVPGYSVEIAEFAIGDTNVGGIDIPVDLPGHAPMRYLFFAEFVSQEHQVSKWCVMVKKYAFLHGKEFHIQRFLVEPVKLGRIIFCHRKAKVLGFGDSPSKVRTSKVRTSKVRTSKVLTLEVPALEGGEMVNGILPDDIFTNLLKQVER